MTGFAACVTPLVACLFTARGPRVTIRSFVRAYSHTPAVGGGCMCPKRAAGTVTSLVVEWLLARRWDTGSRDLIYITYTHSTLPDDLPPRSHRRDNEARMTATPAWTRDAVRDYC